MDINATLLGQMITFAIFIWFTMKFVWPPLMKALQDRRKKIADGLAAAEEGERKLELSSHQVREALDEARAQAAHIIENANSRANHIIEEAKERAREQGERMLALAKSEIEQEYNQAQNQLRQQVAEYSIMCAEKILKQEVDKKRSQQLVDELISGISHG